MEPQSMILLISGVVLLAIFTILIAYRKQQKNMIQALEALIPVLGGEVRERCLLANLDGVAYQVQFVKQGKGPALALITIPGDAGMVLAIRKSGLLDSMGKRFGLTPELKVPDKNFAAAHYVFASDPQQASRILWNEQSIKEIGGLIESSLHYVRMDENGISLVFPLKSMSKDALKDLSPDKIQDRVARLAAIAGPAMRLERHKEVPVKPFSASGLFFDKKQGQRMAFLCSAPTLIVMILMVAVKKMYVPVNAGALMADGFLFAAFPVLIGTILMLFPGRRPFRKAPESHRLFMVSILFVPVILFLFSIIAYMWTNGALDRSRPLVHTTQVVGKKEFKGKGASFNLFLASWDKLDKPVNIKVSRNVFQSFEKGDKVILSTKSGAWGHAWISSPPRPVN